MTQSCRLLNSAAILFFLHITMEKEFLLSKLDEPQISSPSSHITSIFLSSIASSFISLSTTVKPNKQPLLIHISLHPLPYLLTLLLSRAFVKYSIHIHCLVYYFLLSTATAPLLHWLLLCLRSPTALYYQT